MFYLKKTLEEYGEIKVGVVGAGIMGKSLLNQLAMLDNFKPTVMASRRIESVLKAFSTTDIQEEEIVVTDSLEEAIKAQEEGFYIATTNTEIPATITDCVVDCTGDTEEGTKVSLCAIKNKVNIVTLNVEMDATVGPIIKKLADEAGIIYTGTAGDEPGSIIELYEFSKTLGFEVLALGKGKNNDLNVYATPDELEKEAKSKGLNKRMLTSFVDGTNTMIELNAVCNATGFLPDVRGCHCINSTPRTLADDIKLKEEGGIFNSYKTVDFVRGIAPGVFAIVRAKSDVIMSEMEFLKMGDGPNFAIYRPYHLTSIETPNSIIRAVCLNDNTIVSEKGPVAETITIAKRDLKAGEELDGIGGYTIYGSLEDHKIQQSEGLLPIGLVTGNTTVKRDIKKGEVLTFIDVELDENSVIYKLRREQDKIFS